MGVDGYAGLAITVVDGLVVGAVLWYGYFLAVHGDVGVAVHTGYVGADAVALCMAILVRIRCWLFGSGIRGRRDDRLAVGMRVGVRGVTKRGVKA